MYSVLHLTVRPDLVLRQSPFVVDSSARLDDTDEHEEEDADDDELSSLVFISFSLLSSL